jgi:LemA protein
MTIFLIVLAVIVLYVIFAYNGLVSRRVQAKEAWATIDTQLKRRYDLIPNLVSAVKGAAKHEKDTLDAVIKARASAMSATGADKKAAAENQLTDALKSIFALAENYPNLKANENFLELQRELADTETKIQAARQFYNTVVMSLNTAIQQFPGNVIAGLFRIIQEPFFELDEEEKKVAKKAPKVEF